MQLLADIAAWSLLAFGLILFVSQAAAYECGYRLGRGRRQHGAGPEADGVGLFVGGLLGLLAFVLALTLSYGSARFGERRQGTLAEANAIGTAWLRAEAVGQSRGQAIASMLEEYAKLRKAYLEAPRNSPLLYDIDQQSSILQTKIWGQVAGLVRDRSDAVAASLMSAVNETFDMSTAERFALESRFPPQLFWLLIGMAVIAMATVGYQTGLKEYKLRALAALLAAVWTAVIVVILDMSAPRLGAIRTNAAVYDWTMQGFKAGLSVPPVSP
ncbi:MAG: hypothetical protein JSR78_00195 [Proteobacteria bacterium]|nr:hypothetical protein [Pseudomonadota bacterium]